MVSKIRVEHGDSREVIKTLADASIDACVTDPPYSLVSIQKRFGKPGSAAPKEYEEYADKGRNPYLRASTGFMGKQWDNGSTAFDPAFWAEVLRVLKPGAHLVAFGGTRTYHRLVCAIEDAGFEVRDQIGWAFGSGFPKSHNVGNGWGTALKPAWEPVCLARKPLGEKTVAANVLAHGTGALNIDGCRVPGEKPDTTRGAGGQNGRYGPLGAQGRILDDGAGRWPANLIHDGSEEVLAGFPDGRSAGNYPSDSQGTGNGTTYLPVKPQGALYADLGSAARFFYSAKADADDRLRSKHPTVKPVDLMAYLVRLVTPPGGLVLDPFAGSGSTGMACMREGFDCIMIEREAEYVAGIRYRLEHVGGSDTPLFAPPMAPDNPAQLSLLDPYADGWAQAAANSRGCYDVAIAAIREELLKNSAE